MATTVSDDLRAREYEEVIDNEATVQSKVLALSKLVRQHAGRVVVVTGAGISTGAGIPDFRSGINSVTGLPAGKWCRQATQDKWTEDVAETDRKRAAQAVPTTKAVPSRSHMALVALQDAGILRGVISQNTDGLHRRSGFPPERLAELHGNSTIEYCGWCGKEYLRDYSASLGRHLSGASLKRDLWPEHSKLSLINPRHGNHYTGRRCQVQGCPGWLFDSTVDFGDNLPDDHFERGTALARDSTLCIVLGSRCSVSPASDLPQSIGESTRKIDGNQKTLVVVNLQRTEVDYCASLRIGAKIDDVMVGLMTELRKASAKTAATWLAEIPPFVLRRRIRIKHTTASALQQQSLQVLDIEEHSAKQMSVAIGKCLGLRGVTKLAPRAVVERARAKIKQHLQDNLALAAAQSTVNCWAKSSLGAPAATPGNGEVKSELLELRDLLLAMLSSGSCLGTVTEHSGCNIGGGKVEVNAVDSDGMAVDVLWNVKAVLTPSKMAVTTMAGNESEILTDRGVHAELNQDIIRNGARQGNRGMGKHPADGPTTGCRAARGDIAQVLSYPWENHSAAATGGGKGCGYGMVRLKLLSNAAGMTQGSSRKLLTVGADMCTVLQGPSNSGKGEGPQLTHTIQLNQTNAKLSAVAGAVTSGVDAAASTLDTGGEDGSDGSLAPGLGLMLCFRAQYGEPPCVLPLPTAATGLDTVIHQQEEPKKQMERENSAADGTGTPGVRSYEYLMEWCPGVSTEWEVSLQ